jgi:hypothetical protein
VTRPAGEEWFVVNAREAEWIHNEKFGAGVTFEGSPGFAQVGVNIQVIWPGQPNGYYHAPRGLRRTSSFCAASACCSWRARNCPEGLLCAPKPRAREGFV